MEASNQQSEYENSKLNRLSNYLFHDNSKL
jgi:hypothetical protein